MKIILASMVAALFIFSAANTDAATTTDISCSQAFANVGLVKVGITKSRVLELLGQPTGIENGVWAYNFWDCARRPKVGEELVFGVALAFKDGVVAKIGYDTICATGPGR